MSIVAICFIVSMPYPYTQQIESTDARLLFYQGMQSRDFSGLGDLFPYRKIRAINEWESEIELLDGRKVKFGKNPVEIDCKPEPCDKCEPTS